MSYRATKHTKKAPGPSLGESWISEALRKPLKDSPLGRAARLPLCRIRIQKAKVKTVFGLGLIGALVLGAAASLRAEPSPFTLAPAIVATNGERVLAVRFGFPAQHHIYADRLSFRWEGEATTISAALPEPVMVLDQFSGERNRGFEQAFEARIPLDGLATNRTLAIRLQGCNEAECYFPETRSFLVSPNGDVAELSDTSNPLLAGAAETGDWRQLAAGFQVAARGSGYMKTKDFLALLDSAQAGKSQTQDAASGLKRWGWLATLGLIILGGIGLNLTPCILPMIPINLAIIGAGAKNSNRKRGFALGSTYGLGMTMAYGVLGLVVVLTGSKFGTLNSSPWFNLGIAAIFVVLALGMFDRLNIDFSRFQTRFGNGSKGGSRGPHMVALTMGVVAALLAGACVAPVVISVLLLAAHLYSHGNWFGLVLPFCLGLGMALPWPVAGAGLTFLPKPGAWMNKIKYGFGVMIAAMAVYYGHVGYTLLPPLTVFARQSDSQPVHPSSTDDLVAALRASQRDGKPVVIDFWASWCKNCSAMEHTTFNQEVVRKRLGTFHQVKYQAERPNEAPVKAILDQFGAMGLPTYVVLTPPPMSAR